MKKIGKTFIHENVKLITVEGNCTLCYFDDKINFQCKHPKFHCAQSERKDKKSVAFVLVPFKFGR